MHNLNNGYNGKWRSLACNSQEIVNGKLKSNLEWPKQCTLAEENYTSRYGHNLKITINKSISYPTHQYYIQQNQDHVQQFNISITFNNSISLSHSTIQYQYQYHNQQINITFNNSISVSHSTNQYHIQRNIQWRSLA